MSFLLFFFILNSGLCKPPDSLIYWGHKLTPSDYKGVSKYQDSNSAESYVGFICDYSYDTDLGEFKFAVKSYFDPNRSWLKFSDSISLSHEQIHFDIAELFARRLCYKLSLIKIDFAIDEKIEKTIAKTRTEMREYQDLYDRETILSANISEQKRWKKQIEIELAKNTSCQ